MESGRRDFLEATAGYRRVALDTNACIYYLQDTPKADLVASLIERALRGSLTIVISAIVQLELLVRPYALGDMYQVRRILQFSERHLGIESQDISRDVVLATAQLRALTAMKMKVPDALVAGAAAIARCDAVIGNDRAFGVLNQLLPTPVMSEGVRRRLRLPHYLQLDDYMITA